MSKTNPCGPDCPRRAVGCRAECPDWKAAQEIRKKAEKAKDRERLLFSYGREAARRKRRRR